MPRRKIDQPEAGKARVPVSGLLESRTATEGPGKATSTQAELLAPLLRLLRADR